MPKAGSASEVRSGGPASAPHAPSVGGDVFGALGEIADRATSVAGLVREAVAAIGAHMSAVYVHAAVGQGVGVIEERWHSGPGDPKLWKDAASQQLSRAHATCRPIARVFRSRDASARVAILAGPMPGRGGEAAGAIVVVCACADDAMAHRLLAELRACAGVIMPMMRTVRARAQQRQAEGAGGTDGLLRVLATAGGSKTDHELAFSITNSLRARLGCEQVAVARMVGKRARILSVSGFDEASDRRPGVAAIAQAMEECYDAGRALACNGAGEQGHRLHRFWHSEAQGASVASIPLRLGDRIVGVLGVRQVPGERLGPEDVARIEQAVAPLGAALDLSHRATRSVLGHARESSLRTVAELVEPASLGRRLVLLLLLAVAVWFVTARMPYRVSVPAEVRPGRLHHVAAPIDSAITAVHARAGDDVEAGQLLAELDTGPMLLRRAEVSARAHVAGAREEVALASGDMASAAIARAEADVALAELATIDALVASARIVAPESGMIVAGDLDDRIGQSVRVGTPLFELAPKGSLRVELRIPESSAARLEGATEGVFAARARPEQPGEIRVGQRSPRAEVIDGRNVFVAKGELVSQGAGWLRPGMQGVARVDGGERRVWWIALHRAIDLARLELWL